MTLNGWFQIAVFLGVLLALVRPLGTFFRYICDKGTYLCRYDDLFDGNNNQIDVSKLEVSMNGIELQDREFFAAIHEKREPNASVAQCLSAMRTLDRLEDCLKDD